MTHAVLKAQLEITNLKNFSYLINQSQDYHPSLSIKEATSISPGTSVK